mmetsp:Transcript_16444/g.37805  ORF Transcript_16444/g.37805 Transcript_16444/m.37805 type:complete len:248 (+) Transcript_16444:1358-2101(+)
MLYFKAAISHPFNNVTKSHAFQMLGPIEFFHVGATFDVFCRYYAPLEPQNFRFDFIVGHGSIVHSIHRNVVIKVVIETMFRLVLNRDHELSRSQIREVSITFFVESQGLNNIFEDKVTSKIVVEPRNIRFSFALCWPLAIGIFDDASLQCSNSCSSQTFTKRPWSFVVLIKFLFRNIAFVVIWQTVKFTTCFQSPSGLTLSVVTVRVILIIFFKIKKRKEGICIIIARVLIRARRPHSFSTLARCFQ